MRTGPEYTQLKNLVRREGLHTVCEEAGCPNIYECWEDREATFLIGGEQCTRRCDFCQIDTGKPADAGPRRAAAGRRERARRWACGTPPSPAWPATTCPTAAPGCTPRRCAHIKKLNPDTGVELLIPDFNGEPALLEQVFESRPEVLAHNVETVPRIFKRIRPAFRYERSLGGDHRGARLRAGHQEQPDSRHGRDAGRGAHGAAPICTTPAATSSPITQYLRPSARHHPVERWVTSRRVRRARGLRRGARASPGCWPGRWCARRTGPGRLYPQAASASQASSRPPVS